MKKRKWPARLILLLNVVSLLFLLAACFSPYLDPKDYPSFALLGLGFIYLALFNLIWFFFWIAVKRRYAIIPFMGVLLSIPNFYNHLSFASKDPSEGKKITLVTYNVKTFDLYNWSKNKASKQGMLSFVQTTSPDILCLQEFYSDDSKEFNTLAILSKQYPYRQYHYTLSKKEGNWGMATFSKFPIIGEEKISFSGSKHNLSLVSDIIAYEDTIRVYNTHLQSLHLGYKDYSDLETIEVNDVGPVIRVAKKIMKAFYERSSQTQTLCKHLKSSVFPVVICGDFNDSPNSFTYRQFTSFLNDSFKEAGRGTGLTYWGKLPSFRIDYVLADPSIKFLSHEVVNIPYSDHYPIVSSFILKK